MITFAISTGGGFAPVRGSGERQAHCPFGSREPSAGIGREVHGDGHGQPRPFTLGAGGHTRTFVGREPNTKLDQLLLTNDVNFVPSR